MSNKHQEVLDKFIAAYQRVYGQKPNIEVNGGWYKVNGDKSIRLAEIEKITRSLVHTKPKTETTKQPTAKAKPATKPATAAKAKPATKPATAAKAKPAAKPATAAKAKPAAKPATAAKAKPAAKPATAAKAKPAAKPATTAKAKPATKRQPNTTPAKLPSNMKVIQKGQGQRPVALWLSKLAQQDAHPRGY